MKHKVCCIACAKDEDEFIEEWINYHLNLGIDHIYIGDNNSIDKKLIIDNPNVTVMRFNDIKFDGDFIKRQQTQSSILNVMLKKAYNEGYEYCLSIDVDEFLNTVYHNIDDLIDAYFRDFVTSINIVWEVYNDNEIIYEKDTKDKVVDTYITKIHNPACGSKNPGLIYDCTKLLFKISDDCKHTSAHAINNNQNQITIPKHIACINHYRTKCLETYIKHKVNQQELLSSGLMTHTGNSIVIAYFMYNTVSLEKLEAFKELCNKYNYVLNNTDIEVLETLKSLLSKK